MSTSRLTFGPLPEPGTVGTGRRGKHARAAEELRARPGEWAPVTTGRNAESAAALAQAVRSARLAAYEPAGAFEAAARTVRGQHRVYARYVGPAQ
ncbi:hypothetical protein PV318_03185 [Streptomyces sp. ME02-6991-2B]|nr:hypothetical protein [Streptomyces sp. ME02-6991-2B]